MCLLKCGEVGQGREKLHVMKFLVANGIVPPERLGTEGNQRTWKRKSWQRKESSRTRRTFRKSRNRENAGTEVDSATSTVQLPG